MELSQEDTQQLVRTIALEYVINFEIQLEEAKSYIKTLENLLKQNEIDLEHRCSICNKYKQFIAHSCIDHDAIYHKVIPKRNPYNVCKDCENVEGALIVCDTCKKNACLICIGKCEICKHLHCLADYVRVSRCEGECKRIACENCLNFYQSILLCNDCFKTHPISTVLKRKIP